MKQGWEIKKLGEVGTFQRGGGFLKSDFVENGFPCIHYGQIHTRFGVKTYKHLTCINEELAFSKSKIAHNGDVIIAITSEDVEGSCKCTAWLGDYDVAVGAHAAIYRHNLNPAFVAYYFNGPHFNFEKIKYARGFKVVEIKPSDIEKISIKFPSITEQERIVEELDCLSGIIEKKKQQLKELDALAESIFYSMFGDPITNEKGWEVKRWKDMLTIVNGKNQKAVENPDGAYPIYGSGGIMGYADKYLCPGNTIIIGRKGNINKPIFVREQFWNVDTAFGLVPNKVDIDAYYLFYYCRIFDFEQLNKAVTIPSLTKSDLLELYTPCPPLALQQEFADKIEAIEKQKELIKQSITETETLFNARMDYYFN